MLHWDRTSPEPTGGVPLDVDLARMADEAASQRRVDEAIAALGPGWRQLTDRDGLVFVHEEMERVMVIPTDRAVPPSQWGLLP